MTKNRKTENILDTLGVIKIKTLFFSELYARHSQNKYFIFCFLCG